MAAKAKGDPRVRQKLLYDVLLLVLTGVFGVSVFFLARYYHQAAKSRQAAGELAESYVTYESVETTASSQLKPDTGYAHAAIPAQIDFTSLLAKNGDVVGWLFNQNGVINYPVLQGNDNEYYLNHLLSGQQNVNGSLFLDYADKRDFSGLVSVIYGHSMKNGSMFATLLRYRNQAYYDAYPDFYLYTPSGRYRAAVVAAYEGKSDDIAYEPTNNVEEKQRLADNALARSLVRTNQTVGRQDRLLVLSTCAYSSRGARFLVICKLISLDADADAAPAASGKITAQEEAAVPASEQDDAAPDAAPAA